MRTSSKYAIALTAALGLFMAILDNTVVNVALTPMATAFHASLSSIEWVVTGYFLAQAAVIPVSGYFSNRVGIRRLFLACIGFFTVGSLLCGLARDEGMLVAFRVVQGLGGGALVPLAQAIAFQAFPPVERATASAFVGIPVLLAPTFGPTVGGLLTDTFGWESIFFVNVPIGILAVILGLWIIPADPPRARGEAQARFDYVGLGLSIVGVLAVVYAFTLVSEPQPGTETALNPRGTLYGWGYPLVWELVAVGLIILAAFAVYELRGSKDPVLDLHLYQRRDFTVGSLVTWCIAMVIFGSLFLIPVFLEQVRIPHLSALDAGLALMPQGLGAAVAVGLSGRLYNQIGPRDLIVAGSVLLVISSWQLANFTPTTDGWTLLPWLAVRGLGFGFTFIPTQTLALQQITGPALAKASSLFGTTRQIASSIGIAIMGTLFVQQTTAHAEALRAEVLGRLKLPPGVTPDPNNPLFVAARDQILVQAGAAGLNDVFLWVAGGSLVILALAFILPRRAGLAPASAGEAGRPPVAVMD